MGTWRCADSVWNNGICVGAPLLARFCNCEKIFVLNRDWGWSMSIDTKLAYAFSPRHGAVSTGADHLVLQHDLSVGRLHRKSGDALCKPREKFWGLELVLPGDVEKRRPEDLCAKCAEISSRLSE